MRILIGLIEHFGDIVACEPVSRYLREKHPDARLSWAVRAPYRELIDVNPHIDETVILGCVTDWIKLCKHSKYDLVVDLHVNYRVCEDCRVPLIKDKGNPFVNVYEWLDHGALLEAFCDGAGLPKLSAQPLIYLKDEHRSAVDALDLPAEYCVIHRQSNSPAKDWRDKNWCLLVHFLVEKLKLPVVEVGGRAEKGGQSVPAMLDAPVIDLLNRTSLLQTAEVIRRARMFIGVDSGPAHFANAVKTPSIVLLGRIGFFRQYNPFTGFFAGCSPLVRLLRNLAGPVAEIPLEDVVEATRYLAQILDQLNDQCCALEKHSLLNTLPPVDPDYRRLVTESGFFDRAWYVTHHPEALNNGANPLDYFIAVGAKYGHSPGPDFNSAWYNTQRPDLKIVTDPLHHYLYFGQNEGLWPRLYPASTVTEVTPPVEHLAATLSDSSPRLQLSTVSDAHYSNFPRIFAFYLPQFHPISENNYGHRPGFTEWDNVIKSKPLFDGHHQPRVPGELGYYDLRSLDVMRAQVKLANDHGIAGFCFYYYYFNGKKLLYKPIENYINSDISAPFFFLWANENWSRRWDGGDNEVVVSQNHSPENDLAFIRELLITFADERYVKIEGKPILAVYKPHLFANIRRTTELWREEVLKCFPGIYLVVVDDWSDSPPHPRELGFDASYEIPSNIVPEQVLLHDTRHLSLKDGFTGRIVDYRKFASFHMGRPNPEYKRFRTVMAPWDNTPRYGSRAMVHVNTDNDAYKLWLAQALIDTSRRFSPDERIVFLHSWNEWCEGTYVEPDDRYGRRLLEDTKQVVDDFRSTMNLGESETGMYLSRLMREKDEGAARSLQVVRQQNMYLHRDIQDQRAQIARLTEVAKEQAAAHLAAAQSAAAQAAAQLAAARAAAELAAAQNDATLQSIFRSRSWRITKPWRALARLLRTP